MKPDLVERLLKRAEIRRQISTRKSVQEGKPDRIADLLEEAAAAITNFETDLASANKRLSDAGWEADYQRQENERFRAIQRASTGW